MSLIVWFATTASISVAFVISSSLQCYYSDQYVFVNYGYTCSITGGTIASESEIISIFGYHRSAYTDERVHNIFMANASTPFMVKEFFKKFRNLKVLCVVDSKLETLQPGAFVGGLFIQKVNITGNNIPILPNNAFKGLVELVELWLMNNGIETIHEKAFFKLFNLKHLVLSQNKIKHLPATVFYSLFRLEKLSLIDNQIQTIPGSLFKHMQLLNSIQLEKNNISYIGKRFIDGQFLLTKLNLKRNVCVNKEFFTDFGEPHKQIIENLKPCFDTSRE